MRPLAHVCNVSGKCMLSMLLIHCAGRPLSCGPRRPRRRHGGDTQAALPPPRGARCLRVRRWRRRGRSKAKGSTAPPEACPRDHAGSAKQLGPALQAAAGQPCWCPASLPPPGRGRRTGPREPRLGHGCSTGGGLPEDLRRVRVVGLPEATCPVQGVARHPRVAHKLCKQVRDVGLSHGGTACAKCSRARVQDKKACQSTSACKAPADTT